MNNIILNGKQVIETKTQELPIKNTKQEKVYKKAILEETDKDINLTITTCNNEEVKYIFNSARKFEYANLAIKLWLHIIDAYIIKNNTIVLNPSTYWDIYKQITLGKEHIKGTGYTLTINDKQVHFPTPDYYFENKEPGVYAIVCHNCLLYIGSASSYIERWKEHQEEFNKHPMLSNPMYYLLESADNIEYHLLYDEQDFKNIYNKLNTDIKYEYCRGLIYETFEKILIKGYEPPYNKEGTGYTPFKYRVSGANWYSNKDLIKEIEQLIIDYIDKDLVFGNCYIIEHISNGNFKYPTKIVINEEDVEGVVKKLKETARIPVTLETKKIAEQRFVLDKESL